MVFGYAWRFPPERDSKNSGLFVNASLSVTLKLQLKTHAHLFDGLEDEGDDDDKKEKKGAKSSSSGEVASSAADAIEDGRGAGAGDGRSGSMASTNGLVDSAAGKSIKNSRISRESVDAGAGEEGEEEEDDEPPLSVFSSVFWMAVVAGELTRRARFFLRVSTASVTE